MLETWMFNLDQTYDIFINHVNNLHDTSQLYYPTVAFQQSQPHRLLWREVKSFLAMTSQTHTGTLEKEGSSCCNCGKQGKYVMKVNSVGCSFYKLMYSIFNSPTVAWITALLLLDVLPAQTLFLNVQFW